MRDLRQRDSHFFFWRVSVACVREKERERKIWQWVAKDLLFFYVLRTLTMWRNCMEGILVCLWECWLRKVRYGTCIVLPLVSFLKTMRSNCLMGLSSLEAAMMLMAMTFGSASYWISSRNWIPWRKPFWVFALATR